MRGGLWRASREDFTQTWAISIIAKNLVKYGGKETEKPSTQTRRFSS